MPGTAPGDGVVSPTGLPWHNQHVMIEKALVIRIEARAGKESEVKQFLRDGLPIIEGEPETPIWFPLHFGGRKFGIFDAFKGSAERKEHLAGKLARLLIEKTPELFTSTPLIEHCDVLAQKIAP